MKTSKRFIVVALLSTAYHVYAVLNNAQQRSLPILERWVKIPSIDIPAWLNITVLPLCFGMFWYITKDFDLRRSGEPLGESSRTIPFLISLFGVLIGATLYYPDVLSLPFMLSAFFLLGGLLFVFLQKISPIIRKGDQHIPLSMCIYKYLLLHMYIITLVNIGYAAVAGIRFGAVATITVLASQAILLSICSSAFSWKKKQLGLPEPV